MLQLKLDFFQKSVNLLQIPDVYFFISVDLNGQIILGRYRELQLRLNKYYILISYIMNLNGN